MSKMIQIRNVPDALHRRMKARAAKMGLSLSACLLSEFTLSAECKHPRSSAGDCVVCRR